MKGQREPGDSRPIRTPQIGTAGIRELKFQRCGSDTDLAHIFAVSEETQVRGAIGTEGRLASTDAGINNFGVVEEASPVLLRPCAS
jgi:hypothetical protein